MHPFVAGRQVAACCRDRRVLRSCRGGQLQLRADTVPVALMADQYQREPVVIGCGLVMDDMSGTAIGCDNGVDPAIVVDIADGHPPTHPRLPESIARLRRA